MHLRGTGRGRHTTVPEHMPELPSALRRVDIERILREAAAIGPSAAKLAAVILESRPHRACLGRFRFRRLWRGVLPDS